MISGSLAWTRGVLGMWIFSAMSSLCCRMHVVHWCQTVSIRIAFDSSHHSSEITLLLNMISLVVFPFHESEYHLPWDILFWALTVFLFGGYAPDYTLWYNGNVQLLKSIMIWNFCSVFVQFTDILLHPFSVIRLQCKLFILYYVELNNTG
jgi:hypothetical protein